MKQVNLLVNLNNIKKKTNSRSLSAMGENFVGHFLTHTKNYESPESFWRWTAYTLVGATLRDNCYRRFGDKKIFPNIYTLVLADSAVHRKGSPIELAIQLLHKIRATKVIAGRASIQGILDELSRSETDKETGKLIQGGGAIFCAPELSAGIVNDPEAIKILTDIYDFKEEYVSRLRGSGVFRIKNICFSMLAASNEELLRDVYDTKALYGGLLGRTFLIKANEFRPANSLFTIRDTSESFQGLLKRLEEIRKLTGEFEITINAQRTYDEWYVPFRESYKGKSDKSGITGRIHTSVFKLSMIICAIKTLSLEITEEHITEAISYCISLLPNYSSFVMATGKSTVSEVAAQFIEDIWQSRGNKISKSDFVSRHFHMFDIDLIDKCITTLGEAGLITTVMSGSNFEYSLTDKCVKAFGLTEDEKGKVKAINEKS